MYHRQGNEQKQVAVNTKFKIPIRRNLFTKVDGNFTADLHKL